MPFGIHGLAHVSVTSGKSVFRLSFAVTKHYTMPSHKPLDAQANALLARESIPDDRNLLAFFNRTAVAPLATTLVIHRFPLSRVKPLQRINPNTLSVRLGASQRKPYAMESETLQTQ